MIEYTKERPLRVFTAFSGYDSQCLALERLKRAYPDFGYTLVGWSEIDRYAVRAHNALFPEAVEKNYGDISKMDWAQVPDFDLFTMSSPCQDFSSAGLQRGGAEGSGTRSSLLWECRRAIIAKRPRFILFENVKALVSDKFIRYFNKWQAELASYGYTNFAQVLNSTDYGVPQNRERIFMVSILDENARYYFPEPFPLKKRLKDVLEDEVDESYYLSDERVRGLIESTLKEKLAGRGFAFKPKTTDETANALTGSCVGRKTDNFLLCGAIRGRGKGDEADKNTQQLEPNSTDVSNTITSVGKDNVLILGNSEQVANTVTAHYAKEKTSDLVRQSFGGGSYVMEKNK